MTAGKPASYSKLYGIEKPPPRKAPAKTSSAAVRRARELGRLPDEEYGDTAHVEDSAAPSKAAAASQQSTGAAEPSDDQAPATPPAGDDDDQGDEGDDRGQGGDSGGSGTGRRWTLPTLGGGQVASAGAGWILGVLVWGWIVLPFVKGGPGQVAVTLRAKFLNQAKDGSPLP